MYVLTGILGLFGLTLLVLLVVSCFTERAKPQPSTRAGTPNVDGAAGWGPFGFLFPKSWVYVWWGYLAMLGPLLGCRPPVDFRGPYTQYQHRHGGDIGDNVETILSVGPFIHCILMPFFWTCKRQAKAQGYVQQVAHPNKSLGAASRR